MPYGADGASNLWVSKLINFKTASVLFTFLVRVHAPREVPGLSVLLLGLSLVLLQRPLVHHPGQVHDLTADGRLSGI